MHHEIYRRQNKALFPESFQQNMKFTYGWYVRTANYMYLSFDKSDFIYGFIRKNAGLSLNIQFPKCYRICLHGGNMYNDADILHICCWGSFRNDGNYGVD